MFIFIKSEVVRHIKSKRYIACFLLVSLSILILFQLFSTNMKTMYMKKEESYLLKNDIAMVQAEEYNHKMLSEQLIIFQENPSFQGYSQSLINVDQQSLDEYLEDINFLKEIVRQEQEAFNRGDIHAYLKKAIELNYYILLSSSPYPAIGSIASVKPEEEKDTDLGSILLLSNDTVFDLADKYDLPDHRFKQIKIGLNEFGDIYASKFRRERDDGYLFTARDRMIYYDQLLDSGHLPATIYQVDSVTIIYQVFRLIYPIAIPLISIFLFFDNYDKDLTTGTIKTITTLPNGRKLYTIGKLISSFLVALSIILIPLLLFSLILGIQDGFRFINYPILKDGRFLHFSKGYNHLAKMERVYKSDLNGLFIHSHFGLTQVSNFNIFSIPGGGGNIGSFWGQLRGINSNKMVLLPFLTYTSQLNIILYSLVLVILFTLFCIGLMMVINLVVEKKMSVLIVSLFIFLSLIALAPYESDQLLSWLNPMIFRNSVYSTTGFISYPFSLGVVSMLISISILICSSLFYISKKDIT